MPNTSLSGRALAEAAGLIMWPNDNEDDFDDRVFTPGGSASADYLCLEWARDHWRGQGGHGQARWLALSKALAETQLRRVEVGDTVLSGAYYQPGDYARALVAASKEGA